jgi:hypothetical protein
VWCTGWAYPSSRVTRPVLPALAGAVVRGGPDGPKGWASGGRAAGGDSSRRSHGRRSGGFRRGMGGLTAQRGPAHHTGTALPCSAPSGEQQHPPRRVPAAIRIHIPITVLPQLSGLRRGASRVDRRGDGGRRRAAGGSGDAACACNSTYAASRAEAWHPAGAELASVRSVRLLLRLAVSGAPPCPAARHAAHATTTPLHLRGCHKVTTAILQALCSTTAAPSPALVELGEKQHRVMQWPVKWQFRCLTRSNSQRQ